MNENVSFYKTITFQVCNVNLIYFIQCKFHLFYFTIMCDSAIIVF